MSLDDKTKIPLGEPGMPVSTKVKTKSHAGAITHSSASEFRKAADHDCASKSNLTPSVTLTMEPLPPYMRAVGGA